MRWILPISLRKRPMMFELNEGYFVLFFERQQDLDLFVKNSNSLLVDAVCYENWDDVEENIDFLLNLEDAPRVAIVKEVNENKITYEERLKD